MDEDTDARVGDHAVLESKIHELSVGDLDYEVVGFVWLLVSAVVCDQDLESVVAKGRFGTYQTAGRTSWLKIKNPVYSQAEGRHELFARRRQVEGQKHWTRPELILA